MIWLDVTTSLNWSRPPVGIVRTEIECIKHILFSFNKEAASLCYFDREHGVIRLLNDEQHDKIQALIEGRYTEHSKKRNEDNYFVTVKQLPAGVKSYSRLFKKTSLIYSMDPIENGRIRGWAFDRRSKTSKLTIKFELNGEAVKEVKSDEYRSDLSHAGLGDGTCAFSFPVEDLYRQMSNAGTQRLSVFAYGEHVEKTLIGTITIDKRISSASAPSSLPGQVVTMTDRDVYLTCGLDWDNKDLPKLFDLKQDQNFHFIGFCYDLIPFFLPHLCVGDVSKFFARYFTELTWCADGVICISERSRSDLNSFVSLSGSPLPETRVVRLGSSVISSKAGKRSDRFNFLLKDEYILFVSTIERRKNHEVLYKAYVTLVERGVKNIPKLVFVGMRGWGVSDLISDLTHDPRVSDHILIFNDVQDAELALLYKKCLFTVFPSLYEGWGLPVAESLSYGKYCLASGRGSVPEVAGDLLEYIDPWDVKAWADKIQNLIEDRESLDAKTQLIVDNFVADSWAQCVDEIFTFAESFCVKHVD